MGKKTLFVRVKDAEGLFALAGLRSRFSRTWRLNLVRFVHYGKMRLAQEDEELRRSDGAITRENLEQLIRQDN